MLVQEYSKLIPGTTLQELQMNGEHVQEGVQPIRLLQNSRYSAPASIGKSFGRMNKSRVQNSENEESLLRKRKYREKVDSKQISESQFLLEGNDKESLFGQLHYKKYKPDISSYQKEELTILKISNNRMRKNAARFFFLVLLLAMLIVSVSFYPSSLGGLVSNFTICFQELVIYLAE